LRAHVEGLTMTDVPEPTDPLLDQLYRAAREDPAAWGPLADYLEERGADEEAVALALEGDVHLAVRRHHGHAFGLWSDTAATMNGHAIYRTPDGRQVALIAVVTMPGDIRDYLWPDIKCIGPVTEFVRSYEGMIRLA
jgi:hypothetical protein